MREVWLPYDEVYLLHHQLQKWRWRSRQYSERRQDRQTDKSDRKDRQTYGNRDHTPDRIIIQSEKNPIGVLMEKVTY